MAIMSHMAEEFAFVDKADGLMSVDLESSHKVINQMMEALQRNFKQDTQYMRPLMSPQANVVFALDRDAAENMILYMTKKLKEIGGFDESEFRFVRKSSAHEEVLQRLRLDFPDGVNAHTIRKLLMATDRLERTLPPFAG